MMSTPFRCGFVSLCGVFSLALAATAQAQAVETIEGTITNLTSGSDQMKMQPANGSPTSYVLTKNTLFVDGSGNAVNKDLIFPGQQTTIYCTMQGGKPVVTKVVCDNYESPFSPAHCKPISP
jgi:hypothetical protein